MKPFTQTATPHEDILKGRLTMDVFAADLWQVANGKAPLDYQDADLFFRKTYLTKGLKNIIEVAKARLEGRSGDSVIQLQTPFGGGKTHTLVALYHKAKEWDARVIVFDGTALSPKEVKPWEELERQLTGKIVITKGNVAPGKEKIINLLSENSPVLILMDEILEYITKAAGIKIGDSNLASQTLAFTQELTAAVATVGNALLVLTLPSSVLEHYDENAERMFQQLQKITGRIEKIYTPVEDEEIEHVVRTRLFSKIDEKESKKVVDMFLEYARNEGLLSGDEATNYRDKFLRSYPFKPEVVDILYKRWGSFPTFQRTRGVLRLLSLVVHDLLDNNIPFIRLGDFNLSNDEIRRELIKHIGQEWDSIIAQDITSKESGAKKVDDALGSSYKPYSLGTAVSTTIFMTSFSGRGEKGTSVKEIKLSTAYPEFSTTVIDTVINNLKEKLFYISDEGFFFTNQPNLNRIIIAREENISAGNIYEEEKRIINAHISKPPKFKIYIHPKFPKDVPDNAELKLAILNKNKPDREFLEKYGENPRVYRNTLIFLCINENQRESFHSYLRKLLALKSISQDKNLKLTEGQKKETKNKLENYERREYEELRKLYRKVFLPAKDLSAAVQASGYKEIDVGVPTFGESLLDKEIYDSLRSQGEILEKIAPKVIKDKYLCGKDYIEIRKLYDAFFKTPGEVRLISKDGFIESIKEGVNNGLFGFGYVTDGGLEHKCINKIPTVNLVEGEVIVKPGLCVSREIPPSTEGEGERTYPPGTPEKDTMVKGKEEEQGEVEKYSKINLKLKVPVGQISTIARIASYLKNVFNQCAIEIKIRASDGEIGRSEYELRIEEALSQGGIEIEEADKE
ncbi:MAG: ATP-binding protein [Candidatus Marinimicrobia bacterium]|nr:ATP-binding protein [Candidatus Neomarinimicrobiota bacterium]